MRRWIRYASIAAVIVFGLAQTVRPARTNPPTDSARTLHALAPTPAQVAAVLDRACRDCHSNETRWPWYSHVAPVSWFVIDHVNHGRSHFNYSNWAQYEPAEAARLLKESCRLAREASMPLASYAIVHRAAALTEADVAILCAWSRSVPGPPVR